MAEDDVRDSELPPAGDDDDRRRRVEKVLRDTIRRGLEKGLGTIRGTDTALRDLVGDVKLPREIVTYVFSQVDDTKNALVRVVAREVRDFLEATDLSAELKKALTTLSFEIKTEIRFIPNDAGGVKPDVKASVAPRRSRSGPHSGKHSSQRSSARPSARAEEDLPDDGEDETRDDDEIAE
jgi:hypothetical protein